MFNLFLSKLKLLLNNPIILFVYGIMSKWYIIVMIPAIMVTFWVFKGLVSTGVMSKTEIIVTRALQDTQSIARYCTPKIIDIKEFLHCVQNPPTYKEHKQEKILRKHLNNLLDLKSYNNTKDPYAE